MNGFRTVSALAIAATLAACGQIQPPQGATPVHFTVLTKHGGLQSGIFAATSGDDLRSQEVIAGERGLKACSAADERGCLATFSTPPGSLLVALQPMSCADNNLDTAYLKGGTLTFVINWTNTCPPGAGTAAIPDDWVVAVPLHSLPQTLLPLELDFSERGNSAEVVGKELVDLRAPGPGHIRSGNITLEAAPQVAQGQAEHITLTIFGLKAVRAYQPWRIDIAALDHAGRVVWHQAPYDDPTTFTCLVGASNSCAVGSYNVEMPTTGVPPGVYVIRPSFVYPAGYVLPPQQVPSLPPFTLPSLTVEVAAP